MKSLKDAHIICRLMNKKSGYERYKVVRSEHCCSYDIVEIKYESTEVTTTEPIEETKEEE